MTRAQLFIPSAVGGLGVFSVCCYTIGITLCYPLEAGLAYPGASWAVLAGFAPKASVAHALLYALLTLLYMFAVRLGLVAATRPNAPPGLSSVIIGVWLLASGVLLGAYPGDSTDIFDYLFRGRLQTHFGISPLIVVPSRFADQPFYAYVHWTDNVDTYGPLWEYASHAVASAVSLATPGAAADSALLTVYVVSYRLLAIALAGMCGGLIAMIVRRRARTLVPAALLTWLWNPLLLTASAVGAHNDMLMLVFVLLALLLLQRERWLLALLALVLAAHVKLTALLLAPLVGVWLLRRCGWRTTLGNLVAALALAVPLSWLLYAPLGGWASLPRMLRERVRYLANSPAYAVYWLAQVWAGWHEELAWRVATQGATLLFVALAALLLWRFWQTARPARDDALWYTASGLTLLYLLIGSFWFQHWYVLWALAPAALLPERRLLGWVLPLVSLVVLWLQLAVDVLLTPHMALVPWHPPPVSDSIVFSMAIALLAAGTLWRWHTWRMVHEVGAHRQEEHDVDRTTPT